MKKYIILLLSGLTGFIILFLVIINFSGVESKFKCSGKLSYKDTTQPATAYIKLIQYRWWVGLWSNSNGDLFLEIPNDGTSRLTLSDFFHPIEISGDQIFIYKDFPQKMMKGNFSMLSKILAVDTTIGFFDGTCEVIKTK